MKHCRNVFFMELYSGHIGVKLKFSFYEPWDRAKNKQDEDKK